MARGWESKSVEQQQDLASADKVRKPALTAEEAERERQVTSLRLARARVEQQLAVVTNPKYRQTLELELKALDERIGAIDVQRRAE